MTAWLRQPSIHAITDRWLHDPSDNCLDFHRDAHVKNYSIRLLAQGKYHLTRLYDVMSAWPVLGDGGSQWSAHKIKLAMALLGRNRHYTMHTVQRRHFSSTAEKVAYAPGAESLIEEILARTPQALAEVRADLPAGISVRVTEAILGGVEQAATALRAMSG